MQDIHLEGTGSLPGGEYGRVDLDGVIRCKGNLKAASLEIEGVFNCDGSIETGRMLCEGVSVVSGDIRATSLDVQGVLKVKSGTRLEADTIRCEGVIKIDGEVSADRIDADGIIVAREIVGDTLCIRSIPYRRFLPFLHPTKSRIALIEATTVELHGVVAESVNGVDVTIGRRCIIENVDCSGKLIIHPEARVRHVTGSGAE